MSVELLDSEVIKVDKVLAALGRKQGTQQDLESYRKEIINRFAEIGLVVEVIGKHRVFSDRPWDPKTDGLGFSVDIIGRCNPKEQFDYDRQSFEIIHDVANIEPEKKGTVVDANGNIRSAPTQH